MELEQVIRDCLEYGDRAKIDAIISQLSTDFAYAIHHPNARNGGLIGLAAAAIALGQHEVTNYLDDIVHPVLACFGDQDARVRYYACESMYNIAKVAKGEILPYFNELFDALCKLSADSDESVQKGTDLLNRLIKDIVAEKAATYVSIVNDGPPEFIPAQVESSDPNQPVLANEPPQAEKRDRNSQQQQQDQLQLQGDSALHEQPKEIAFSLPKFIPLLMERMYVINPSARTFLVSWITLLDSIPDLELVSYLPAFLSGLINFLNDPASGVRVATHAALDNFLLEIGRITEIKKMVQQHQARLALQHQLRHRNSAPTTTTAGNSSESTASNTSPAVKSNIGASTTPIIPFGSSSQQQSSHDLLDIPLEGHQGLNESHHIPSSDVTPSAVVATAASTLSAGLPIISNSSMTSSIPKSSLDVGTESSNPDSTGPTAPQPPTATATATTTTVASTSASASGAAPPSSSINEGSTGGHAKTRSVSENMAVLGSQVSSPVKTKSSTSLTGRNVPLALVTSPRPEKDSLAIGDVPSSDFKDTPETLLATGIEGSDSIRPTVVNDKNIDSSNYIKSGTELDKTSSGGVTLPEVVKDGEGPVELNKTASVRSEPDMGSAVGAPVSLSPVNLNEVAIEEDDYDEEEDEEEDEDEDEGYYIPGQDVHIDFEKIIEILISHLDSSVEEIQVVVLRWIEAFLDISPESILPYGPRFLSVLLPTMAYDGDELRKSAERVNQKLLELIMSLPDSDDDDDDDDGDINGNVDGISKTLSSTNISGTNNSNNNSKNLSNNDNTNVNDNNSNSNNTNAPKFLVDTGAPTLGTAEDDDRDTKRNGLDYPAMVNALTLHFLDEKEETRVAALDWLIMLHRKVPKRILAINDGTFPALLKTLSDPSEQVITRDLRLLAQISYNSDDEYFTVFMVNLLNLFSTDRRLLETRGNLIIRQLCLSLKPERIYWTLAEILEKEEEDLEFAGLMVQYLNNILLTAPELSQLRMRLRNLNNKEGISFFTVLFRSWCHNPSAALTLCLLAQAYEYAFILLQTIVEFEITIPLLVQIDKLVQLLESPVFTHLRLQLLEPEKYPFLYKCLYGILMLLPQSSAFSTLRNRLNSVSSIGYLHVPPPHHLQQMRSNSISSGSGGSNTVGGVGGGSGNTGTNTGSAKLLGRLSVSGTSGGSSSNLLNAIYDVRWPDLVKKFQAVQQKHQDARNKASMPGMAGYGGRGASPYPVFISPGALDDEYYGGSHSGTGGPSGAGSSGSAVGGRDHSNVNMKNNGPGSGGSGSHVRRGVGNGVSNVTSRYLNAGGVMGNSGPSSTNTNTATSTGSGSVRNAPTIRNRPLARRRGAGSGGVPGPAPGQQGQSDSFLGSMLGSEDHLGAVGNGNNARGFKPAGTNVGGGFRHGGGRGPGSGRGRV